MELLKLFSDTEVSSLEGLEGEADLSAIRSLQYETFSLPVEDKIVLEELLQTLTELQRKVVYPRRAPSAASTIIPPGTPPDSPSSPAGPTSSSPSLASHGRVG